mmetsp:Transcript_8688/g.18924  ORF Transcript_8688/g.18924 Transcript_8688/m.18924 type:complete len:314 (+) Transcript_8688:207-1148(+)
MHAVRPGTARTGQREKARWPQKPYFRKYRTTSDFCATPAPAIYGARRSYFWQPKAATDPRARGHHPDTPQPDPQIAAGGDARATPIEASPRAVLNRASAEPSSPTRVHVRRNHLAAAPRTRARVERARARAKAPSRLVVERREGLDRLQPGPAHAVLVGVEPALRERPIGLDLHRRHHREALERREQLARAPDELEHLQQPRPRAHEPHKARLADAVLPDDAVLVGPRLPPCARRVSIDADPRALEEGPHELARVQQLRRVGHVADDHVALAVQVRKRRRTRVEPLRLERERRGKASVLVQRFMIYDAYTFGL